MGKDTRHHYDKENYSKKDYKSYKKWNYKKNDYDAGKRRWYRDDDEEEINYKGKRANNDVDKGDIDDENNENMDIDNNNNDDEGDEKDEGVEVGDVKTTRGNYTGGEKGDKDVIGSCPECGSDVVVTQRGYSCSAWREGCKFTIWKNAFEKLKGKPISKKMAIDLLNNKQVHLGKMVSIKTGKEFEVDGILKKDDEYGWKIKFIFSNEKQKSTTPS